MTNKNSLELYLHIPFCIRKCGYCDFLSFPAKEEEREWYVGRLTEEIEQKGALFQDCAVSSVFLGGGTPSVLEAGQSERIMEALYRNFTVEPDAEITTEANPGTLSVEKLKAYKRAGINRISLGLQSTEDEELARLGRIHTYGDFLKSYALVRETGFTNVNVDLMSALPGQTEESWQRTLKRVCDLEPEHISAYSLIIEEGTPFGLCYGEGKEDGPPLPGEEADRRMYELTCRYLPERGLKAYEISNYARPGFACRHNIGYWTGVPYLGLGLGASSYIKAEGREEYLRFCNESDMAAYLRQVPRCFADGGGRFDCQTVTRKAAVEEFMFLGLRMTDGISEREFLERFQRPVEEVYGQVLAGLTGDGLLIQRDGRLALTRRGIDVSNQVFCRFLLDQEV